MFRALVLEKEGDAAVAHLRELDESALPAGDVTVAVEYSTLNYKDGLALSAERRGDRAGLAACRRGSTLPGWSRRRDDARYKPGDKVVLTGWRVGEVHWGGYAQKARVKADWLVPLPSGLTTRQAMAVGTAGFTAMLAVMALEEHGLTPGEGRGAGDRRCGGRGVGGGRVAGAAWVSGGGGDGAAGDGGLSARAGGRADRATGGAGRDGEAALGERRPGRAASMPWAARCWRGCWGR